MDTEATARDRQAMVDHLCERGILYSQHVIAAMTSVPRHAFVPPDLRDRAYDDNPLPIGHEQVITAPHLVAQMTELLEVRQGMSVLEIGTGCGYHAAVFAEIVGAANVMTIERIPVLARGARDALGDCGYSSVTVLIGDGSGGFPGDTTFERISVAAASKTAPEPLLAQLAADGRMVIPVGPLEGPQELTLVVRQNDRFERWRYGGVYFVPLVERSHVDDDR